VRDPRLIAALAAALAAAQGFQLYRTLKTGRIRYRFGVLTRKGQPGRFGVYVISAWVVLALCAAAIAWALGFAQAGR
jgi:hypothetical protein